MADAMNSPELARPAAFRQPRPLLRWLAFALACTAGYICLQLEIVSYGGAESGLLQQLCGGGERSNCRSVLMSSHGSLKLGEGDAPRLPVATVGAMYFAFVAIWYLFLGPVSRERRYVHLIILAAVVLGVLMSLDYVRVMAVVLRQWCGGCLAVHAINGAILVVTIAAWPWGAKSATPLPHPSNRLLGATLAAGVLAALAQFGFALFFLTALPAKRVAEAYERVTTDPEYVLWNYRRQPILDIPADWRGPVLGDPNAPHMLVVFTDFTCPRCKRLHGEVESVVAKFAGRLRVFYRNFPLDPACNPHPKWARGGHRGACDAALAFELSRALATDSAARRVAELFEAPQSTPELTNTSGVGAEREKATALARVQADIELGASLGLNEVGTPVAYLDGRRFDGWQSAAAWDALLGAPTSRPADANTP